MAMRCVGIWTETAFLAALGGLSCGGASVPDAMDAEATTGAAEATTEGADVGPPFTGPIDDRLLVHPPLRPCDPAAVPPSHIRVASWNMAAVRGTLSETERVLRDIGADVVLLQEVDVLAERTTVDQPRVLSEALDYEYAFASALEFQGGDFGLAVLSRFPFARADRLSLDSTEASEARIAFDVEVCVGPTAMRFVNLHADFIGDVNVRNIEELADYLAPGIDRGMLVGGDFNATPMSEGVTAFREAGFFDVFETWDPGPTRLDRRIDYVFLSGPLRAGNVADARRVENDASDHVALQVDLSLVP
jgi:endonuclease/exonuclease/phosphatase family metal-dependent hydrolase